MTQKRRVSLEPWNRWMWFAAWVPAFLISGRVEDFVVGENGSFAVRVLVHLVAAVMLTFVFATLFGVIRRLWSRINASDAHVKQPEK